MKFHHFAAATLLLGSSALALAATDDGNAAATHEAAWNQSTMNEMARSASLWKDAQPAKSVKASAATWESGQVPLDKPEAVVAGDPDLDLAEKSIDTSTDEIETALAAESADPVLAEPAGKSLQDATPMSLASADLAPRPASQNYPACQPGPGDDSCIQLYEPGVRTSLATWSAPTGGLSDGSQLAMGGPLEEDDALGHSLASDGDHLIDASLGEEKDGSYAETAYTGAGSPLSDDS